MDNNQLFGGAGMRTGRANINEHEIFKPNGWATLYPKIRGDLIFVIDDGYYPGNNMAALTLDPKKFPSYAASEPAKSLRGFNDDLKKAGWRGLGLWTRGTAPTDEECIQRLEWSRDAGILYWKIDTKDPSCKYADLARPLGLDLILENSIGSSPLNHGPADRVAPNYGTSRLEMLKKMAVVRIYDRDQPLSLATSTDRVTALLRVAADQPDASAIINCEDEVYLGAALGCSVGIFRTPYVGLRSSGDMDIYMGGPKHPKLCIDEVTRAVRWQRLAPPFAANAGPFKADDVILTDSWKFSRGDSWDQSGNGKVVSQAAPARVSRGLPLADVKADGNAPWLLASRNPNGAVTVAALGRITPDRGYFIPKADVELDLGDIPPAIGVFGGYRSLTFRFEKLLPIGIRILAQDLAGDKAEDITDRVVNEKTRLTIPGELIERIGLSAASPNDHSDPGLVIVIK